MKNVWMNFFLPFNFPLIYLDTALWTQFLYQWHFVPNSPYGGCQWLLDKCGKENTDIMHHFCIKIHFYWSYVILTFSENLWCFVAENDNETVCIISTQFICLTFGITICNTFIRWWYCNILRCTCILWKRPTYTYASFCYQMNLAFLCLQTDIKQNLLETFDCLSINFST